MTRQNASNADQIEYWNGKAGENWAAQADRLDAMLSPYIDIVLSAAQIASGQRVLDVGCGSGALSRAALAAGAGHVTGVDVSGPMLALARKRAEGRSDAEFIQADASVWQADGKFDRLISRFGVMFFADPQAAFANLRAQMAPDGRLAFVCWQPLSRNDWAVEPLKAALSLTDEAPTRPEPGAPGPFAFEDADRTVGLLSGAGWKDATAASWTGKMRLPGDTVDKAAVFAVRMGPAARLIAEKELDSDKVFQVVRSALAAKADTDGHVRLDAAVWIVTAQA